MTAADSHVSMTRGHSLSWAGAWKVVVMAAAGIITGDGWEGVQRQILVQETAGQTDRQLRETVVVLSVHCVLFRQKE